MTKTLFDNYIKKFSLGKIIAKAKIKYVVSSRNLHTRATADNTSFVSDVILKDFKELGDADAVVCVGDNEKLKALISPFTGDIKMSLNFNSAGDKVIGLNMSDEDVEVYFGASEAVSIPPAPKNLEDMPAPDVIVPLTDEFIKQFLKAKVALDETASFSIAMNKKGTLEFVFGYLTSNSNKIRISPKTDPLKNKLSKGLQFPVLNIAEAFRHNTDIENGTLEIYEQGIVKLSFENELYKCSYYQFSNSKE